MYRPLSRVQTFSIFTITITTRISTVRLIYTLRILYYDKSPLLGKKIIKNTYLLS